MDITPKEPSVKGRVLTNYARLGITFFAGVAILRLVSEMGTAALATFLLLTIISNIALVPRAILQESAVPSLGWAFQSDQSTFDVTWRRLFKLAVGATSLSIAFIAILAFFIDTFETAGMTPTVVLVALAAVGLRAASTTIATPALNLLLVSGRIVIYNAMVVLERLAELGAAIAVTLWLSNWVEAQQLLWFYIWAAALHVCVQLLILWLAQRADSPAVRAPTAPRDLPRTLKLRSLIGWNILLVLGYLGHLRITALAANVTYGATAILVMGVAFVFANYLRQLSMGLAIGLDAISSRSSSRIASERPELATMARSAAFFQAGVVGLTVAVLWNFIDPLLRLWLGDTVDDPAWDMTLAVIVVKLLLLGTFARAASEGWMKILNGQGRVGSYAGVVFAGAILNLIALATIIAAKLDVVSALIWIAALHAAIFFAVHLIWVPLQLASMLEEERWSRLASAVAAPTLVAASVGTVIAGTLAIGLPWLVAAIVPLSVLSLYFLRCAVLRAPNKHTIGDTDD